MQDTGPIVLLIIKLQQIRYAAVHDSRVDLAKEGEVRYGDKGYSGAKTKGYDASMKRAARGHPLGSFSVIKTVFNAGHVRVTTVKKAAVKVMFSAISYNLYNLYGLVKKEMG